LESTSERGQKLRTEFKQLEEEAFKVMEKYQAAQTLLDEKTAEVQGVQKEYDALKKELNTVRAAEIDLTNQIEDKAKLVREYKAREASWNQKLQTVESKFAQLAEETPDMAEKVNMDVMEEELGTYDAEDVKREITRLEQAIASLKPNMGAIAEYRRREKEYMERVSELDAITETRDAARREYEDLRKQRLDEVCSPSLSVSVCLCLCLCVVSRSWQFMNGFNKITMKLKEMYQMVTLGGDAELELVDTLDPFSEGIVFSVRPPKKSWKNVGHPDFPARARERLSVCLCVCVSVCLCVCVSVCLCACE
jgi:structural maintenance of chromosome 4